MREMAERRPAIMRRAAESGREALAVERVRGGEREFQHFGKRREKIRALDNRVRDRAGFCDAGPDDDAGLTRAALVGGGLAAAERGIARDWDAGDAESGGRSIGAGDPVDAAVVGEENDNGVFAELECVERIKEAADIFIEALDHGGVDGIALAGAGRERSGFGAVFFDELFFCVVGRVDGEGPVVDVERCILVRGDEGDRLARHAVLDVFIGSAGDVERGGKFPRRDVAAGRTGAGPVGEIHVEALLQRAVGLGSEVPFAEVARGVASCLERFRERVVARIEAGDTLRDEDGRGGCGLFHRALFQDDLR